MEFRKSASNKTIIVTDNQYNALGLPTSLKTGIIRPKEGSDLDAIVSHLQSGDFKYEFATQGANGIYEMEFVGVGATAPAPASEVLETA